MRPATRILVVDDERYLADLIATALRYQGYETTVACTAAEALELASGYRPHLVVLDVVLPDLSGWEVCARLRSRGDRVPVLFLTARDATEDTVHGLRIGGDDYVTKPFSIDELAARVEALLRRAGTGRPGALLRIADLEIDVDAYRVHRAGTELELTPTEFALLRLLVAHAGRVLSKRRILAEVWEYDFGGNDGVVQTYVSYLRRKLDAHGPPLIHTVPRVGYVVRAP
ncbi:MULTISPECIES: response regulator transcription factor [Pseudonocardia]|uniref:DNA-binding response regulator n=2 Tax=Pseudonocardia TaxID=1847 RepID=A0ABQ0RRV0_9PSEU|nr:MULTISPECIES: response regulator transcription factor [Pseudonocardia]OSY43096.1 putative transcriptional regulatory protein TcrX [Pseudonocardia autotrophica]TDN71584.1 two-component system OmpR family response regulator [Pseudonocardia autotrophica]BBG02272.1 DNA-binding response regulator [Pseudonocardia autotrophica]GEC23392.1 DNA-binding response regulator [Pseudonocardia saturnea]